MATTELLAEIREVGGKGHARQLRMKGRIPGIVYGAGEENVAIAVDAAAFHLMLRHISSGNAILDLKVKGRPDTKVLIKEVQRNPMDQKILHVDLEHISMTRKVRVHIPILLTGTPEGVKEGGILEHLLREVEIECLPTEIPERIELDVSHLIRGQSIHVRDLPLADLHVHDALERVVATVVGKMKEEEPAPAAAAEAATAEEGEKAAEESAKAD